MYRGEDPQHPENVALRRAYEQKLPLIWFVGVASGLYEPIYPVWVVGDNPAQLEFALALDEGQRFVTPGVVVNEDSRRYVERLTKARLHQRVFRSQVLLAYDGRCAICRIRHAELLDAAHIIADGMPNGEPVVPNELSLCKIHHAAFDHSILGIRPDLTLHVRQDILEEVDGWMLRGDPGGAQHVAGRRSVCQGGAPKPRASRRAILHLLSCWLTQSANSGPRIVRRGRRCDRLWRNATDPARSTLGPVPVVR
jgi:putative restriction endonuclease